MSVRLKSHLSSQLKAPRLSTRVIVWVTETGYDMASSSDNGLESGRCCANIQTTHKSLYSAAAFINSKAGSHIGLIAHFPRSLITDYVGRLIKKDCTIKLQARKTLRSRAPSEICHIIYIGACNNIIRNKLLYKSIHSHTQGS